ncbi:MAG: chromosome segregation protein SMC [Chloroflexota bacterium]
MHLKRLELIGFKSFASKTVLELDRGITAVVGPNGSGKSNLVDAIRWALGEQSLRAVRSRKSEEVIFAGNTRKAPVGMAEVTLVLDNSDGTLPMPFAEVSISRRQYRSGEGEYLINRTRARLKDVVELLTHASLGPDAYAVVGQGAVDEVLLQRPEERRSLVEAAADISRYQLKLKDSLDRLSETEGNIQRAEDIRGEITPRLAKLRTQAHRAQRYEQLIRRMREMVQWRYLLEIRHARERAAAELEREGGCAGGAQEAARLQEASRQQVSQLRNRLRDEEAALEAARERLNALRLAKAKSEREAALIQEREAAFRRQRSETEEDLTRARKERLELEAELQKLEALRSELAERVAKARSQLAPVESERQRAGSELRLLQAQLERLNSEQQAAAARRLELQERRNSLGREIGKAESVRKESLAAAEEATGRLARLEEEAARAQEGMDSLREQLAQAEARQKEAQEKLRGVAGELDAARREERQAWERDSALRNKLSLLQSLREEHRGLASGAKVLLEAKLPGIRGTLASMMRVPQQYVTAVGAALGGAQGYVVSEGFREGLEALQYLSQRKGRATIAPMQLEKRESPQGVVSEFRSRLDGLLEGIKYHGLAADLVSYPEEARDLAARYLGLSLVVEALPDALELYRRLTKLTDGRMAFQVVTLDGRLVRARGDLASSTNGEKDGGLLARETELLALSESAAAAGTKLDETKARVAGLEAIQSELSRELSAASAEAARLQKEIAKRSSASGELASQLAKLEAAIEWQRSRAASAEREGAQAQERLAKMEQEQGAASNRESEVRAKAEQLREDLAEQQSSVAEIGGRLSRLQGELSTAQGLLREQEARISALSDAFQRSEGRVRRQEDRVTQLSEAVTQLAEGPQATFSAEMLQELEALEKQAAEASTRVARLREACDAAEAQLAELAEAQESAREQLSDVRSRAQRASVELLALVREAARDSGLEMEPPEDLESTSELLEHADRVVATLNGALAEMPADGFPETLAAATQKVEALRKELQSLGTINAEAPEEYRLLSERNAFLTTQMDDLREAEHTLRKAIEELRQLMAERFQGTFDLVNAEFARCFSILFGGGSAKLVLTQPDQPLEGGVEVMAVPPGKKGGSLLGLSGGERALTAVALLFALMKVNPSPFCLLDEVDAALDESNVRRFCDMVKDLTETTQFLVITHNRATMEVASVLYGVSMTADSTSRVVSLRLAADGSEAQ